MLDTEYNEAEVTICEKISEQYHLTAKQVEKYL